MKCRKVTEYFVPFFQSIFHSKHLTFRKHNKLSYGENKNKGKFAAKAKISVSANVNSYYQLHKFSANHAFILEEITKKS